LCRNDLNADYVRKFFKFIDTCRECDGDWERGWLEKEIRFTIQLDRIPDRWIPFRNNSNTALLKGKSKLKKTKYKKEKVNNGLRVRGQNISHLMSTHRLLSMKMVFQTGIPVLFSIHFSNCLSREGLCYLYDQR
jgi:hypothetical protein